MDWENLLIEAARFGYQYIDSILFYKAINEISTFNTWKEKNPLKMLNEYFKIGINGNSLSAQERLLIKVLEVRRGVLIETFDKEYPFVTKFLEESKSILNKENTNIENKYFSRLGEIGGRKSRCKKALLLLAIHELGKGITYTAFKRKLMNLEHGVRYEGIAEVCYDVFFRK